MRLFSWVSLQSPIQHKIGLGLKKIIPKSLVLPIIEGPCKGKKWIVNSSNLAYFLGCFELDTMNILEKNLNSSDIFYDIGANVGLYSLLGSKLVGNEGVVVAFEPVPQNVEYLKKHLLVNNCKNVMVIDFAVSDQTGQSSFFEHPDNTMGFLSENGQIKVNTITLDEVISSGLAPAPNCIKIDVEGAKYLVLKGASSLISTYHPSLIISIHSDNARNDCTKFLKNNGYEFRPIDNKNIMETNEIFASFADN
ncbi:MAG: FkbM family methyltransferase [Methanosarcina sp.]|jgi:FkbM family methyltransferase|nr:FkbM family methyltransferase [Methanosarcina sp.]MDD4521508.1 FkbM family methyltransferase [Methanosarcina sp.]